MYLTVCKTRGNHKPKGKNPYNTTQDVCTPYLSFSKPLFPSLRKHPFLLALRRWRRFTRRKFHTDDANQCLHNESGSHWVPNINEFVVRFMRYQYCVKEITFSMVAYYLLLISPYSLRV